MAIRLSYRQRFQRKLPRLIKSGRQWARCARRGRCPDTRLVFVVGSQRSGTRLPLHVMDHAPEVMTYSEGAAPFFDRVLLRPLDEVASLAARSVFPVVALKPICETHRVNELLDHFPRSRAVWIFRNYEDAVHSASVKWTSGREAVRRLAGADPRAAGWRSGGLSDQKLMLVRKLYRADMSLHDANALMWYLRNALFFDLQADKRRDILLIRYEDLVSSPHEEFERLFGFIDVAVPSGALSAIRSSSGGSRASLQISAEIRDLCDAVHHRLVAHNHAVKTLRRRPPVAPRPGGKQPEFNERLEPSDQKVAGGRP